MTFFENFIVNASLIGYGRQEKAAAEHNCNIPWAILMDPTSACNLHCTGCWAAEYGNKLNMSFETMDNIIRQGKELGTYMYIFSGGEPMVRKDDIIRLCETHPDCMFLAFTNGTLIDDKFAEEMLRVKNFVPAISVEGFEEATDSRRGAGTYQAVMGAMQVLKEHKLPFGISCCYTSQNLDSISSEAFIDDMVARGAKFAWYFHYMPVGNDAVPELLPHPPSSGRRWWSASAASGRPSPSSPWTSRTTASSSRDVSPAAGATCTSTPTATWSPARSSTTPTPACTTRPCWRP